MSPSIALDTAGVDTPAVPTAARRASKFDPVRLRLPQTFEGGAVTRTSTITARKPDRHNWFMVHPDADGYHFSTLVLDIKADRELYLIAPELRDELGVELVPRMIVPCITRQATIFLWPLALPDSNGRANSWTESALEAVRAAMEGWVRVVPNMEAGGYDLYRPRVQLDLPTWPDLTLEQMLEKAFNHQMIESLDHPRVRALRGEV